MIESFPNPSEDDIEAHVQKFSLVDCIRDGEGGDSEERPAPLRTNCYYMCRRPVERNQASWYADRCEFGGMDEEDVVPGTRKKAFEEKVKLWEELFDEYERGGDAFRDIHYLNTQLAERGTRLRRSSATLTWAMLRLETRAQGEHDAVTQRTEIENDVRAILDEATVLYATTKWFHSNASQWTSVCGNESVEDAPKSEEIARAVLSAELKHLPHFAAWLRGECLATGDGTAKTYAETAAAIAEKLKPLGAAIAEWTPLIPDIGRDALQSLDAVQKAVQQMDAHATQSPAASSASVQHTEWWTGVVARAERLLHEAPRLVGTERPTAGNISGLFPEAEQELGVRRWAAHAVQAYLMLNKGPDELMQALGQVLNSQYLSHSGDVPMHDASSADEFSVSKRAAAAALRHVLDHPSRAEAMESPTRCKGEEPGSPRCAMLFERVAHWLAAVDPDAPLESGSGPGPSTAALTDTAAGAAEVRDRRKAQARERNAGHGARHVLRRAGRPGRLAERHRRGAGGRFRVHHERGDEEGVGRRGQVAASTRNWPTLRATWRQFLNPAAVLSKHWEQKIEAEAYVRTMSRASMDARPRFSEGGRRKRPIGAANRSQKSKRAQPRTLENQVDAASSSADVAMHAAAAAASGSPGPSADPPSDAEEPPEPTTLDKVREAIANGRTSLKAW